MSTNYYVILGVPFDASGDDIKAAFRRRALELHPDTSGMESGPFLELQEGYGVLSDPQRRWHYDREVHAVATRRRPWGPIAEPLVRERPRGDPLRSPAASRNFRKVPLADIFERERPASDELFDGWWSNFESVSRPKSEALESLTVETVISQMLGWYFSSDAIGAIRHAEYLRTNRGVNLPGLRVIFELMEEVERSRPTFW